MAANKFIYEKTECNTDSKALLLEETIFHSGNGYCVIWNFHGRSHCDDDGRGLVLEGPVRL